MDKIGLYLSSVVQDNPAPANRRRYDAACATSTFHQLAALCYVLNLDPQTRNIISLTTTTNYHYTNVRWVTKRENCQNLLGNKTGITTSKYVGIS
ncbi:hypothetical protein GO988_14510 [Hymenobacter sp. HMF4947]|uniref:Uncharacterized protein n=1 Tax=Hymenobacter ginkgonis TaxID=2682976 RepID=A0A7K1TGK1_9BACT|nr:hypothetical protein [Hymenobacter ginkgonis]MVN77545.1 hypothetical protein [Hymenobacter ginkgonis]